jgi:predicted nucleic acid-binding protein
VTLIVDAGPVIAMGDRRDPRQASSEHCLRDEAGALVIPAPVTAEIDHVLARRGGREARRAFLDDLAAGRFQVECVEPEEYPAIAMLERMYADLDPGLSDLSIVVLAHRVGTTRIATYDERHFRALRPLSGGSFTLLPLDR